MFFISLYILEINPLLDFGKDFLLFLGCFPTQLTIFFDYVDAL